MRKAQERHRHVLFQFPDLGNPGRARSSTPNPCLARQTIVQARSGNMRHGGATRRQSCLPPLRRSTRPDGSASTLARRSPAPATSPLSMLLRPLTLVARCCGKGATICVFGCFRRYASINWMIQPSTGRPSSPPSSAGSAWNSRRSTSQSSSAALGGEASVPLPKRSI
jgi:hypothetical protein